MDPFGLLPPVIDPDDLPNWILHDDEEVIVANYLKTRVDKEDYIYVVNHHLVTYYLTQAKLPTKFVFISHLTRGTSVIAGRDPLQELKSILNKKPLYIILSTRSAIPPDYHQILKAQLKKSYTLEKTLEVDDDSVMIYRFKRAHPEFGGVQ